MRHVFLLFLMITLSMPAAAGHGEKHIFVTINGLVCDFCARSMEKIFLKKDPVAGTKVDLTTKVLTIDLKQDALLSDDDVKKGITDAGYTVVGIKRD